MEHSAFDVREALEKCFKEYHSINSLGSKQKAAHYPEDIQNKHWVSIIYSWILIVKQSFNLYQFFQIVLEKVHGANLSLIYDGELFWYKIHNVENNF